MGKPLDVAKEAEVKDEQDVMWVVERQAPENDGIWSYDASFGGPGGKQIAERYLVGWREGWEPGTNWRIVPYIRREPQP